VAYTIAAQESYPSWGHMLANGATTLWERWEHATGSGMNSHNHPMLGSVGAWFYRNVAGIQADAGGPGFACFHVRPAIDGPVTAARATVQSVRGPVHVDWQTDGNLLRVDLEVPTGSVAFVHLPAAAHATVYEDGVPIWQAEKPAQPVAGLRAIHRQDGTVLCTVGGGRYALERRNG
jgi:alpha-L-rhamnosidase